jgi:hypothetical protein
VISEHVLKGRWKDVRGPSEQELKATAVLRFVVDEASAKVRQGPPLDDEEDYSLPVWAGVLPLKLMAQEAMPDSRMVEGVEEPGYVRTTRF